VRALYEAQPSLTPALLLTARGLLGGVVLGTAAGTAALAAAASPAKGDAGGGRAAAAGLGAAGLGGLLLAGLELGSYNFAGTALQAQGLALTSATRGAFLIQLTSVLTPALAALTGERVSRETWVACGIALAGSLAVASDRSGGGGHGPPPAVASDAVASAAAEAVAGASDAVTGAAAGAADSAAAAAAAGGLGQGELLILSACFFYAWLTVRLGAVAPKHPSLPLAAVKAAALGSLAAAWALSSAALAPLLGILERPSDAVLLGYAALGPGAAAGYLRARGQAVVPAAQAQVIFSSTPIWSAALAFALGERAGPGTWAGGALIVAASLYLSRASAPPAAKEA
jgi:drug/metabolite transporter (DMT)-like permease